MIDGKVEELDDAVWVLLLCPISGRIILVAMYMFGRFELWCHHCNKYHKVALSPIGIKWED